MAIRYSIKRDFSNIREYLEQVTAQADQEREALGFLPAPAYEDAGRQGKLLVLLAHRDRQPEYGGHLLFGGAFPNLRVRQICVPPNWRRHGNATKLLRSLKSIGESEGYLSITANVASDLTSANAFYERNGFTTRRIKAGGAARKRVINVKTLTLDTPNLIEMMSNKEKHSIEYAQPRKRSTEAPLYAIDLNVFFDAVKVRSRSQDAHTLFNSALSHQIRIAVTEEFVQELKRQSHDERNDPVLSFAKGLPTIPKQNKALIESLFPLVAEMVFSRKEDWLKQNNRSDVLHLCHAIAAGAVGYITSDKTVLDARENLMTRFSLDIFALSEFVELLDLPLPAESLIKGTTDFHISQASASEALNFFHSESVDPAFLGRTLDECDLTCISDGQDIVGIAALSPTAAVDRPSQLIVCVRQEHPFSSTIADFLISEKLLTRGQSRACTINLLDIPNHPITRRISLSNGFRLQSNGALSKLALGHPVTTHSWESVRLAIERLGGLKVQKTCPTYDRPLVIGSTAKTGEMSLELFDLESILSPTLFVFPGRQGVVAPITADFANALLGTEDQYSFLEVPEAQFLSRRTYYNTIRAAKLMIQGSVIAFYESARSGGRGSIVALARIVDVVTVEQNSVPEAIQRAAVVQNLKDIAKSDRVLATTFDNLLPLKKPITRQKLIEFGFAPKSNFITATQIGPEHLEAIVKSGFSDE